MAKYLICDDKSCVFFNEVSVAYSGHNPEEKGKKEPVVQPQNKKRMEIYVIRETCCSAMCCSAAVPAIGG